MTRDQYQDLCSKLLSYAKADEVFITLNSVDSEPLRFVQNMVLQSSRIIDTQIQLTVRIGKRYASAASNDISDGGLESLAAKAMALAEKLPEVDIVVPFPEAVQVKDSNIFAVRNADIPDAWRSDAVRNILEKVKQAELIALGHVTTSDNTYVIASSHGAFLYQSSSTMYCMIRVYNKDGSSTGQAEGRSNAIMGFSPAAIAQRAIDNCIAWKNPIDVKADRITTLFHPDALADLFHPFIRQFDQQAVNDNRSIVRKLDGGTFVGTKIFPETTNLSSDPYDARIPSIPFSLEGLEIKPAYWIKNGVIENIAISRFEAAKQKKAPFPTPTNLKLEGGAQSLDELIRSTKYALYVQGFAQIAMADATNCLLTGSTRDGLFLIEDGKITNAVKNLLIRETPAYLLNQIKQMGTPQVTYPRGVLFPMLLPPLLVKDVMYQRASGAI